MKETRKADAPNPPRQDAPTTKDTPQEGATPIIAPDREGKADKAARVMAKALDGYLASGAIEIADASPFIADEGRHLCSVTTHKPSLWGKQGLVGYIEAKEGEDSLSLIQRQIEALQRFKAIGSDETAAYMLVPLFYEDGGTTGEPILMLDVVAEMERLDSESPLTSIEAGEPSDVSYPTDKMNSQIWDVWQAVPKGELPRGFKPDGSGLMKVDMASKTDKGLGKHYNLLCRIDFKGLEDRGIIPRLTPYDKRVYVALASLWHNITKVEGRSTFSLTEIYREIGNEKRPSPSQLQRIGDSLTKMAAAHIRIDNLREFEAYGKYGHFTYEGSLLPMERLSGYVDGQLTEGLVHMFREPPAYTFGRERNQITGFTHALLQTPLSKTDKNLAIEDYLLRQIAWMKNDAKRSKRITFADMFEELNVIRRDERARHRTAAAKALDHYVKCGWIKGHKTDASGIVIEL